MISSGEWVYFVDGDDWINKFTIKRSIEEMGARAAADMILVGCEFAEVTSGKRKPLQDHLFWTRLIDQYLGQTLCPSENLDLFRLDATICRKLFRKSFLDSIGFSFADNSLFEDVSANYQLLLSNPRISLCDYTAYNYRIGHSSRITKCSDRRLLDVQKRLRDCIDMLVLDDSKLELWSVFFQYQGWIHQWLLKQIEFQYKKEYAAQCVELFRSMPWEVQTHLENSVIQELAPSQLRDLLMAQSKGDIGMLLRIGTMPKYQ
jgi:hypothetical protein